MLRVDRKSTKLERILPEKLADVGYKECDDLRELIAANSETFFMEIGQSLMLIGKEVKAFKPLGDSIDLLAIDAEGNSVVIELKRGKDKLQLLQSITYAAMIAKWQPQQFFETRADFSKKPADDARQEIDEFLANYITSLNQRQRIILVAEEFDPSIIVSAEWLNKQYDVEIECFRLELARHSGSDFLSCSRVYPPLELMHFANSRWSRVDRDPNWPSWEAALADIANDVLKEFFRSQVKAGQESRLRYRELIWRIDGDRRFYVSAKRKYAYAWQSGRFSDDIQFWENRLGSDANVKEVSERGDVRFYLRNKDDFEKFLSAVTVELVGVNFVNASAEADERPEIEADSVAHMQ